jgi:CO/xanthine dehydrogenase FAD-binding subunit
MAPESLAEALRLLAARPRPVPFAGGTELMIREQAGAGEYLFLHRIPELRGIGEGGRIGAALSFAELIESPLCPPLLRKAALGIGAPGIRSLGTVGGNICNASPAGDSLPPLYLYDTVLVLASPGEKGEPLYRRLPIEDFILGVKKTALGEGELLASLEIPAAVFSHSAYEKAGARKAQAISKVSFAAAALVEGGQVRDFRAAFGAAGPRVIRCRDIEETLRGAEAAALGENSFTTGILRAYGERFRPIDDQRSTAEYRRAVCLRLLGNFLAGLSGHGET